jgi:probable rRNA maturation factor
MKVEIEINKQFAFRKFHHFEMMLQKIVTKALQVTNSAGISYNVSLLLCSNEYISELNKQFRGKDCPTNVLSFSDGETLDGTQYLGDIAISIPKITEEALEQNKTFRTHFVHMFTHGILHLLGFDHQTLDDTKTMENLEDEILSYISSM